MGKKSPAQPTQPDQGATALAQAAANKEAAVAQANINMVNQYGPQGSLEYTERGKASDGTPQYSATQKYSPEQQALYDLSNQAATKYGQTANTQMDAVSSRLAQPLDFSSLGAAPVANEQTRQTVADAMYQRLNPQFDRDRAALETSLANQGITIGSQAYNTAIDEINRSRNDARLAVEGQAGNTMAQLYGMESTARNSAINEMVQQRQIPLNELAAMMSGVQVQGPSYINPAQQQVAPGDIAGATYANYQGAQNAYNSQMQSNSANTQGLYGLLGTGALAAAMKWSDRRLKTNIERIGTHASGLPWYRYNYVWGGTHEGVMADEVAQVFPHAVHRIGHFDAVDYSKLEAA